MQIGMGIGTSEVTVSITDRQTHSLHHNTIYIYIYIYIRRALVDTKSLCGYVSNQVQYNMEIVFFFCKKLHETQGHSLYSMN